MSRGSRGTTGETHRGSHWEIHLAVGAMRQWCRRGGSCWGAGAGFLNMFPLNQSIHFFSLLIAAFERLGKHFYIISGHPRGGWRKDSQSGGALLWAPVVPTSPGWWVTSIKRGRQKMYGISQWLDEHTLFELDILDVYWLDILDVTFFCFLLMCWYGFVWKQCTPKPNG